MTKKKDYAEIDAIKSRAKLCFWVNLAAAIMLFVAVNYSGLFGNSARRTSLATGVLSLFAAILLVVLNFRNLFERMKNQVEVPHRRKIVSWCILCVIVKVAIALFLSAIVSGASKQGELILLTFVGVDALFFELLGLFGIKLRFRHMLLQFAISISFFLMSEILSIISMSVRAGGSPDTETLVYELVAFSVLIGMVFASSLMAYFMSKLVLHFLFKPLKQAKEEEKEREENAVFVNGKYFRSNATKVEKGKITSEPETIRGKKTLKQKVARAALKVLGDKKEPKKKAAKAERTAKAAKSIKKKKN